MITLHRLASAHDLSDSREEFWLNPDLIQTVEANPDTVVSLTTQARYVVSETPEEVQECIRAWRAGVIAAALKTAPATRISSPSADALTYGG